ncbi:type II secretion system F family protein [Streptomyces sp. NPDC001743]|uniref:type II secretion system F family protein n=1 Tax=Streptomyces sp. NPDC001743 TaxID=3154397 RepID=UPI00332B0A64
MSGTAVGVPEALQAAALCAGAAAGLTVAGRSEGSRRARAVVGLGAERMPMRAGWESGRIRLVKCLSGRREWLCLPVALALAGLGDSVLPVLAGVAAVPVVRQWLRKRRLRGERERRADGVIDLCGAVVGELRAGHEPGQALLVAVHGTGALGTAGPPVSAAARFGGDIPRALGQAAGEPGLEGLAGVAACWRVAADGGAGLAAGLDRLEGALRAERRQCEQLRAQLAGAWSTVVVLAALPTMGLGLGTALGAQPLRVLLHTPAGLACLVLGASLEATGLVWATRIVRKGEAA